MKAVTYVLFEPIIDKEAAIQKNKENNTDNEDDIVTVKSEKQVLLFFISYFVISFSILCSLYALNNKYTLLLLSLQISFFICIPFYFKSTRVLLKVSLNYIKRLCKK